MKKLLLIASFLCAIAFAQTDSGTIRVLATDPSMAPIPDASVKLINTDTGIVTTRETGTEGYAVFSPITRGNYTAEITKTGFRTARVTDLKLDVDERRLVQVELAIANASEVVEVSAAADVIQTEQGSIGQVIEGAVAVQLPLAARRYTDLALLVPGATESTVLTTTRGPGWFVVNGNYQAQNNFIVDGVDNNQGTTNAQALSAQVVQPSPDAISEFKVQTNGYSAEFGRSAGAVVNVSIKSGTNTTHGSAWLYNRDKSLAATPWASNLIGQGKPELKWNQFGGTIGGPIVKNKLFYFTDYEGFLRDFADALLVTVPTEAVKSGVFYRQVTDPTTLATTKTPYPNNTIPATQFDPLGLKLLQLYPKANLPGNIGSSGLVTNNYGVNAAGNENTHKGDIKGDYNPTSKDILSLRYSMFRQDIYRVALFPGVADGANNQGGQFNVNHSFGATWTRTLTPTMVNVFRFGYNRTNANFTNPAINEEGANAFGFKIPDAAIAKGNGGIPQISVSNYNALGTRNFRPQFQKPELFQFLDTLSIIRGAHTMRLGFETRQKNDSFQDLTRTVPAYTFGGRFTGEAAGDLLTGYVQQFDANTQTVVQQLQKAYAGFFQDDWKLLPTLTLNLGLRYEYTTPYYAASPNRNINFDPKTGQLVYPTSGTDYLVNADHSNLGPRLGLAWQAVPRKVVLRAGYGMFFSGEDIFGSDINLPLNPPQLIPVTLQQQGTTGPAPLKVSDPVPSNIFSNINTNIISLRAREKDFHAARIHQFNLALQFALPSNSTFEVAYVGNRGNNLQFTYALNQTPFGIDGSVAANRPFPQWSQITMGATRGQSKYNSLQLKFEKQLTHGFYTLASYTWASAMDQAGSYDAGTQPQYLDQLGSEWGPQSQTARHKLTWSTVYALPMGRNHKFGANWNKVIDGFLGGWQLSGILSVRTGLPINVTLNQTGVNPANNQNYTFFSRNGGNIRPNRVGDANSGIDPKVDRLHFLDSAAFAVQIPNTPGNSSRNVALGPNNFNTNLSLVKRFSISERQIVDFRFEAFNAFNTVNFANPNTTFGTAAFGQITSAGDPRQVQIAIRYGF